MDKITFTRNQFYELIWSKSISTLAKEFGSSDYGLRKICKVFNIPIPYSGYWAKLKYDKQVRKVNLPTIFEGQDEIIINPSNANTDVLVKDISARTTLIKEIESKHKHLLEVRSKLTNPDALIKNVKDFLTSNKHTWLYNGLITTRSGFNIIKVAPDNVNRALVFMDALIKLIRARGYEIKVDDNETYIIVFGVPLVIRLQERLRCEEVFEGNNDWKTRHCYPTGIFMVRCWKDFRWQQKIWMDGKLLIEYQLSKIVAGIELLAQKEIKERLEIEEGWKREEEKQRLEEEKQRLEKERFDREELDGANFQKLLGQSNKWKQSQILDQYISEIENTAILTGALTEELQEWLIWAKKKAYKFNPLNDF